MYYILITNYLIHLQLILSKVFLRSSLLIQNKMDDAKIRYGKTSQFHYQVSV